MKSTVVKNGQEIIIRSAKVEDAQRIIEYVNTIPAQSEFLTFGVGEFNVTLEREEAIIMDSLIGDNKLFIIAEIDGRIVGNLNFNGGHRSRTWHTGEFGVSVLKEYWGMGVGRELINYMLEWAKKGGVVTKINLRVREDNLRAQRLYENLGFKREGVITRDFLVNGKYYSSIAMGIELE